MAVITISRQFGAGGWTLGSRLAKSLGCSCINEEMIKEAAAKLNVSTGQIHGFEKDGATLLMRFIDKLVNAKFIERQISEKYGYVNEENYVNVIRKIIIELYEKGNSIIIGRGAQFILKGYPGAWHILLVENIKARTEFMMKNYNLSRAEAEKAVQQRDQTRKRFLSFFTDSENIDCPNNYDLVINMDRISMEKAENLVLRLISE